MGRKKKNRVGRFCAFIICSFMIGILGVQMWRLKTKNDDYTAREAELQVRLEQEQKRAVELEEYEVYVGTDAYIENTAKTKLGMLYDDEIVFREER